MRTFRVFVSSTFSDLKAERDALQRNVFPRLRLLCDRYGARFQAIDLRWGVSEQASLDQRTMSICLGEIARCQKTSPRPNFVILLGERYGWRPLPEEIPAVEFEQISNFVSDPGGRRLLEAWYRRDENAVPAVYCLQPRAGRFEEYTTWESDVERPLGESLRHTVDQLELQPAQRLKYTAGATHQEIVQGALQVEDASSHVYAFCRRFSSLPRGNLAGDFLDLDKAGFPDKDAYLRLVGLREELRRRLPDNVHEYMVPWQGGEIAADYLARLCQDVYDRLAAIIQLELDRIGTLDPLDQEIAGQTAFGEERRRAFTGRVEALDAVARYLRRSDRFPLAVVGEPGAGKTSLLAEAARHAQSEQPEAEMIVRYIGATPESSNGRLLLESLCRQIARSYNLDESTIPSDYRLLALVFPQWLSSATASRPLIVILDALDQLSDVDPARSLVWLPAKLPEHVHLIVSTLPGAIETVLQLKLPGSHLIELGAMPRVEASPLVDRWLAATGRCLQPEQREHLLTQFATNGNPLYLRLAFEVACRWKSYTPQVELPPDIPGIVRSLLARLGTETHHGEELVAAALGLLAASKNGLTEDELLDLLSMDGAVMQAFRRRSPKSPPLGSLPVVIWSRLFADLEPFLAQRQADGTSTITFYHPSTFGREVENIYLIGDQKQARHQALAEYFSSQPHTQVGPDGEIRPSLRKLAELPYQQAQASLWPALQATLTDFAFLQAKVGVSGAYSVVEDYDAALRCGYVGDDLAPLQDALRLSAPVTLLDPQQLAGQIVGRLGEDVSPSVKSLLDEIRRWRVYPWLQPLMPSLMPTGGPLLHTLQGHTGPVRAVAFIPASHWLISGSGDGTIRIWDLERVRELACLSGHAGPVTDLAVTPDGWTLVSSSEDGTLKIWDLGRGTVHQTLVGHLGKVLSVKVTNDGKRLISGGADGRVILWDLESGEQLFVLSGHTDWVRAVALTADGRHAVSASDDQTVKVWDLERTCVLKTLLGHQGRVNDVCLTPNGCYALSAGQDKRLILWDIKRGEMVRSFSGHGDWVRCVAVTNNGRQAISGSEDYTLKIWDLGSGGLLHTLVGHTRGVWDVSVSPDGKYLASASQDQTIKCWDPAKTEAGRPIPGHPDWSVLGLAVTPDGRQVVSASGDQTLKVWNMPDGQEQQTLKGHEGAVNAVTVTSDGRRLVSASTDGTLKVWELSSGQVIHTLTGHTGWVNAVALTPDNLQAISASHDQSLSVWDLIKGVEIRPLVGHVDDVTAVVVASDGKRALSASWDGQLILWDLGGGRVLQRRPANFQGVRALLLFPDSQHYVVAGDDGNLRLCDLLNGEALVTLSGHQGIVWRVILTPDGRHLISTSEDRTVKVWDLQSYSVVAAFTGESPMRSCAYVPGSRTIVAGEQGGRLHFLCFMDARQNLGS